MTPVNNILLTFIIFFAFVGVLTFLLAIVWFFQNFYDSEYNKLNDMYLEYKNKIDDYKKANSEIQKELLQLSKENSHLKLLHNYKIVKEEEMK